MMPVTGKMKGKRKRMKRKIVFVLAFLLAIGMFAGCGEETSRYLKDISVSKYVKFESEYKGLEITVAARREITEEDVNSLALSAYGIMDRAVENGDTINLDYAGTENGVAFAGGTAQGATLGIGSGQFIPGFEEGLIGVMPGETVELPLTFPENYNPEMAGKEVVFTVTVNYIYATDMAQMTDENVAIITEGEYTTVEGFLGFCREYLELRADYEYNTAKENAILAALEGIVTLKKEAPNSLIEKYSEPIRNSLETQAAQLGADAETLCQYYYQTDSASYIAEAAGRNAKQGMFLQYIANEEGLNVSDEELDESLKEFVEENNIESVEALLAEADKEEFREYFMYNKVIEFILENAQITEY